AATARVLRTGKPRGSGRYKGQGDLVSTRRRLVSLGVATATTAAMTIVSMSGSAGAASGPSYQRLAGSAAPFASYGRATGAVAGSVPLTIQVWMQPGHLAAAERYATAVSTPASKFFHHYLSPDAYTARFGTSRAAARAVESWLRGQGFTGIHADAQRNYVRATAPVATINTAFKIQLQNYRSTATVNAGRYQLRANNRAVAIPKSLSGYVLGVTGLDNAAPKLPLMRGPLHQRGTAAGRLLALLRPAFPLQPAEEVRSDVLPDSDLRLQRPSGTVRLRDGQAQ